MLIQGTMFKPTPQVLQNKQIKNLYILKKKPSERFLSKPASQKH